MQELAFKILGVGAWGSSFRNWQELKQRMAGEPFVDDGVKGPKPEVIPANERRRAPLPVRLAVEASSQACANSGLAPENLGCVFVSGLGDTQLTDYMCKVLAGENKALSPTKFHNSVHNAAAGYWTISTDCMQAANSIAGFGESVSLTLMEALVQAQTEQRALLITFYDAPSSPILKELLKNEHAFSVSIVLAPSKLVNEQMENTNAPELLASTLEQSADWPSGNWEGDLADCYANNPVARILPFLELLTKKRTKVDMPLSNETILSVSRAEVL